VRAGKSFGRAQFMNSKSLDELITPLRESALLCHATGDLSLEISGLSADSRAVRSGELFVAIKGQTSDGHRFLRQAILKGAAGIVISEDYQSELEVPTLRVTNTSAALSQLAAEFYGSKVAAKFSVGVTGTNGKTSVAFLTAQAIASVKGSAVYGGTLGLTALKNVTTEAIFSDTETTSPGALEFHRFLADNPCAGFAVELSSHALHQRRLEALELDCAVFMNLTRDHLDYHQTMEDYFAAKRELFIRDLAASNKPNKRAVINIDSEFGQILAAETDALTFSTVGEADVMLTRSFLERSSSALTLIVAGSEIHFESRLIGRYNLENLTAVVAVLHSLGFSPAEIESAMTSLAPVPGRLETIARNGKTAVIDYAHTPDALEKAITAVRELGTGKVITVFGCGGDRDRGKRPQMGKIAQILSDKVVVTSDNPRSESPEAIIEEIITGTRAEGIIVEADREGAIRKALEISAPGDIVLIAGKGHEPYQEINGTRHRFLDREVAARVLNEV